MTQLVLDVTWTKVAQFWMVRIQMTSCFLFSHFHDGRPVVGKQAQTIKTYNCLR